MRNNLLVTILFLASSSIILSQDLRIKNLQIESKNNGTVIQLDSNRKVNLENVTAWYSSEWFYMTIYDANADSLSLTNYKNDSLKNIEVSNSDESTQIAVQLFSDIESFEINTPNRKTLQFFLRNSQLVAKNSISVEDGIDIVQAEEKTSKEKPESKLFNDLFFYLLRLQNIFFVNLESKIFLTAFDAVIASPNVIKSLLGKLFFLRKVKKSLWLSILKSSEQPPNA